MRYLLHVRNKYNSRIWNVINIETPVDADTLEAQVDFDKLKNFMKSNKISLDFIEEIYTKRICSQCGYGNMDTLIWHKIPEERKLTWSRLKEILND